MAKRWGSVEAAQGTAGMCRTGGVVSFLLAVVFALLGIVVAIHIDVIKAKSK